MAEYKRTVAQSSFSSRGRTVEGMDNLDGGNFLINEIKSFDSSREGIQSSSQNNYVRMASSKVMQEGGESNHGGSRVTITSNRKMYSFCHLVLAAKITATKNTASNGRATNKLSSVVRPISHP